MALTLVVSVAARACPDSFPGFCIGWIWVLLATVIPDDDRCNADVLLLLCCTR